MAAKTVKFEIGDVLTPIEAMKLAISQGEMGWGRVSPNPLVGCVILDSENRLLSMGYHKFYGGAHAEIDAILKVTDAKRFEGATVYVTLEPCAHVGKTGSCAQALAKLPVKKVVYGLEDPYVQVAGKGVSILREARATHPIEVELFTEPYPEMKADLERLCEAFLWNQRERKPFVALKVATTLDGILASRDGDSKWISNETSRGETHRLRAGYDAILVGKNTVFRDNPSLDIRHADLKRANKVIVLDNKGEALAGLGSSNIYSTHRPQDIYWVVEKPELLRDQATALGVQLLQGPIEKAMETLFQLGVMSIFVEGGATVHSYFLNHGLAQKMYLFMAPSLAGANGKHWTEMYEPKSWADRLKLQDVQAQNLAGDTYITARLP